MSTTHTYPVSVRATLQPDLSRWLWLVKWLLVIPHYLVLAFLWLAYFVLTAVALAAIVITGRYPRSIFDFNVGVLRWSWRVAYYAYGGLGTDRYPPFGLDSRADYPADLEVAYPDHLSRGLALIKWWLLAIPHYLVVALLMGGGWYIASDDPPWISGWGLIGVLVAVAGIVLLFTGAYPRPVFDLVLGLNRWVIRVAAYASLMTDVYPPFRLDQGGDEPEGGLVLARTVDGVGDAPAPPPAEQTHSSRTGAPQSSWGAGRVVGVVFSSLALVVAAGLLIGGLAARMTDAFGRDADGFLTSSDVALHSDGHAIASEDVELRNDTAIIDLPARLVGEIKVEVDPVAGPVFVGLADRDDVREFLLGTPHSIVTDVEGTRGDRVTYEELGGRRMPARPASTNIWVESSAGEFRQTLRFEPEEGDWTLVVMRPDRMAPVDARVRVGATVPWLDDLAYWLLASGLVLAGAGGLGLWASLRRPRLDRS